ncbi:hypothetical protein EPA93_43070 [Ktedonosporobacter rubrisoli]|uniref:Uncharacterized protein n=1 Tax=Ktedonosporobacter rubrisoli TaxID=2509675 RepID=A0A4P6K2G4_KTERU|nr:hypothetical protein [Ktedonosporobacter rubrisoli]QBD82398.1 hypothetical protein EPA93_43070 [Ktedonosporobacter rubrisoli]
MEEALLSYENARACAQQALQICLRGDLHDANALLLRTYTALRRLSGELSIVQHGTAQAPFTTRSFAEAQAWGWFEIASGIYQLQQNYPGASLVHFKKAWRIWRFWDTCTTEKQQQLEAARERIRASFWLGEAWSRTSSDRAARAAQAILNTALTTARRIGAHDILQETLQQQQLLPPAFPGTPAYKTAGPVSPYICQFMTP